MKKSKWKVYDLRAKDKIHQIYCKEMNKIANFHTNHAKSLALEEEWSMYCKRV